MTDDAPACRLYLITPPRIEDAEAFADALTAAFAGGDVAALQIRLKGPADPETGAEPAAPAETFERLAPRLIDIARAHGAEALINDCPALAKALGADGVHIGQQDADYAEARALLGADAIIGVTCHDSRHHAMRAAEAGADYVAFGAFYDTETKQAPARADLEILEWWSEIFTTPCVAIGGVTPQNAATLSAAGADFLAVSSAVWNAPDGPSAAVAALNAAIAAGLAQRSPV